MLRRFVQRVHINIACFPARTRASTRENICKKATPGKRYIGSSGRRYLAQQVLRHIPPQCVYLATSGQQKYVIKEPRFSTKDYDYQIAMYQDLDGSQYIRLLRDTDPDKKWYALDWCSETLLALVPRASLSPKTKKTILRDILRGIAELHAKHIVHAGRHHTVVAA